MSSAFTLVEVVISIAIIALVFGTIIKAYDQAARRAEWSGYSLAAQALAIQQLEQARAGVWDTSQSPVKNDFTNLALINWRYTNLLGTGYSWTNLDLPISTNGNFVRATNYVTVRTITPIYNGITLSQVQVQMVRVDTVWPWTKGNATRFFTNSVSTYFAPDNRDPSTL